MHPICACEDKPLIGSQLPQSLVDLLPVERRVHFNHRHNMRDSTQLLQAAREIGGLRTRARHHNLLAEKRSFLEPCELRSHAYNVANDNDGWCLQMSRLRGIGQTRERRLDCALI